MGFATAGHGHLAVLGQGAEVVQQGVQLGGQRQGLATGRQQAVLGLGQEQHVADHLSQALEFFQVGVQGFAVFVQVAILAEDHLGLGQQVRQRRAQFMGDVGGEGGKPLEGVVQPAQHCIEGAYQFHQLLGDLIVGQAGGQGAGGNPGGHFGHTVQGAQAAACGPGAEQGGGQGGEPDGEPDQPLHAFEKVLVVGDVQREGQPWRSRVLRAQRRAQHPVVGAILLPVMEPIVSRRAKAVGTVEPAAAIAAFQAQGEVRMQS
ncbi:hypothetical protein D9M72_472740 [compost metagenome]